jgi:hypothetical protein
MLSLAQPRRIEDLTVFRDSSYRDGARAFSPIFYCLPERPRLAVDEAGRPKFQFLWYRAAPGQPGSGGLLMVTVDLAVPAEKQRIIREKLQQELGDSLLSPPELQNVPFRGGTVEIAFAGEQDAGDAVQRISGSGPARLLPGQQASFLIELTAEGAAVLWETLERRLPPFLVHYELEFDGRLDDVSMRIWCQTRQAHSAAGNLLRMGQATPHSIGQYLMDQRLAGLDLKSELPLPPEHRAELEKLGARTLERALAASFLKPGGQELREWNPSLETSLNMTFDESCSLPQWAVYSEALTVPGTPAELSSQIRLIDLAAGNVRRELAVLCTVNYDRDPIDKIRLLLQSGDSHGDLLFEPGITSQVFRSIGPPRYRYSMEVFYRGRPEPRRLGPFEHEGTSLVLDLDSLGVLQVSGALRIAPLNAVKAAVLDIQYSESVAHRAILDGEHPSMQWTAVVDGTLQPYQTKVDWLLLDGRRLEGEWQTTAARQLFLDVPASVLQRFEVLLLCADSFEDIAKLLLDIRTLDGTAPAQFAFTKSDDQFTWKPQGGALVFEYRRTLIDKNGNVVPLDSSWVRSEARVLPVSAGTRHKVDIVPRLLDLGGALRLALLDMDHPGDGAFRASKTIAIPSRESKLSWIFRSAGADEGRYRYRLTLIRSDGSRMPASEWRETDETVLVLQAPHDN